MGFSVNTGEVGWIQRNLTSAGGKMHFGNKDFKTHAEIESKIYDIIGVSQKVLTDFIFVEQGKIEEILFNKTADRQKSLQNLFGTQQAELIREYLQTEINSTVPESRSDAIQKTQAKLDELEAGVTEWTERQRQAKLLLLSADALELYKGLVARREAQMAAIKASSQASTQVQQYEDEIAAENVLLQSMRTVAVEYADILTGLEPLAKDAHKLLEQQERALDNQQIRSATEHQLRTVEASLSEPPPQRPAFNVESFERARTDYHTLLGQATTSAKIASLPVGQPCPTCYQTLAAEHVNHHVHLNQKLAKEATESYETLTHLSKEIEAWQSAESRYRAVQEQSQAAVGSLRELLGKLPNHAPVPEDGLQEAREAIQLYDQAKQTYQNVSQDIKVAEGRVGQLTSALGRARGTLSTMSTSLGEAVTDGAYNEASKHLDEHGQASNAIGEATGRLSVLLKQQADLQEELSKYQQEELKLGQIKVWRDTVERARGLLHREQLPAVVARVFLEGINRHLARYLEIFEVPFTARLTADEVMCSFGGKPDVPAGRLSGGQKVMLGLAFRFAIYDQFVSSLGILMLDEPTVYLDDDHVDVAVEMLAKIKSYSKGAGLQLIVVTHDQRLASVFDQTIRV